MTAYYNENDPTAAAWLRELINAGHIAPGIVDERSIEDVAPNDLAGYTQCHFFAGIGVWSYALRLAGWPDNRPIWTASCPCQPFSASGRRSGFDDERHLWPHLQWLIEQRDPSIVVGEQVASKAAEPWVDLVQADMEALGYAFGCVPFPSAGVGCPGLRDRAYWVGDASGAGLEGLGGGYSAAQRQRKGTVRSTTKAGKSGGLADPKNDRHEWGENTPKPTGRDGAALGSIDDRRPGPTNGFWRDADWLHCRDGKWRPVRPGTFPLANGAPARVGRLRGYGNAINAEAARAFIESVMGI